MSVTQAGEVPIHYLITKEAIRYSASPRIRGEHGKRKRVDMCFLTPQDEICASFELKQISLKDEEGIWPGKVRKDVEKHLDPADKTIGAPEYRQRYNAVLLFAPKKVSPEECTHLIAKAIGSLLTNIEFFISEWIELNTLEHERGRLLEIPERGGFPWNLCRIGTII